MNNPHRRETRSSWADLLKNKQSQNQIMKNPHRRSSWADLPLDIQASILGKLNLVDIIRFRAVCKNWHIPKDRIIISKHHLNLPWICKLSRLWGRLQCEIYDPHSRQIINTWKPVVNFRYTNNNIRENPSIEGWLIAGRRRYKSKIMSNPCSNDKIYEYGSKQGWLIAGIDDDHCNLMFMYNPYNMKFISLPPLEYSPDLATFSGNPVSQYCQVFVYCRNCCAYESNIYSYCLNGDNVWSLGVTVVENTYICGLEYVNGKIFCLFRDGITEIYSVEDRSWTLLDRVKGSLQDIDRLWLAKGEGDLLMAVGPDWNRDRKCLTFYFDWSNTIWVQSDLQGSTAIFICGDRGQQATVRPFVDCDNHDTTPNCNLHLFDICYSSSDGTKNPSCYSFTEMRKHFQPHINVVFFIEPPVIN